MRRQIAETTHCQACWTLIEGPARDGIKFARYKRALLSLNGWIGNGAGLAQWKRFGGLV